MTQTQKTLTQEEIEENAYWDAIAEEYEEIKYYQTSLRIESINGKDYFLF